MKPSESLRKIIEHYECGGDAGKYLQAYKCPAGIWTIGMGNTCYADGTPVKEGDRLADLQAAYDLFDRTMEKFIDKIVFQVKCFLPDYRLEALASFAYNVGVVSFIGSNLMRKVKQDQNDPTIRNEFIKWVYSKGRVLAGLQSRRRAEAHYYFTGELLLF